MAIRSRGTWVPYSAAAKQMMTFLLTTFDLVAPVPPFAPWEQQLQDAGDWPIWVGKTGDAQLMVSENRRAFPPQQSDGRHAYEGIEYLTGQAFLALILGYAE